MAEKFHRKKILVMSDSSKLHTGFARVTKEIFTSLQKTGKYEIVQIGWFHQDTLENVSYPIWPTARNDQGKITHEDKYAHKSFPSFVDRFKPDLVWTLGDMWMIDHVAASSNRKEFKWVGYFPIDGEPAPSKWGKIVEAMDHAIAYGQYGKRIIEQRAKKANLSYIPHGVNTKIFFPKDDATRKREKKLLLGVDEEIQVVGIVARNQPRKAFDKLFESYFYVINGSYCKCNACEKITVDKYDLVERKVVAKAISCKHCGSSDVDRGKERNNLKLYVHAAAVDCGWDLIDLQNDFNLMNKILINPDLKIGAGVSEPTLAAIYNSFDVFTLPTRGEGFGLPVLEAMACGVPIVVTDYSAHTDWANGCGELIPPAALVAEPLTNIRRAVIDIDLYVTSLVKLLDNKNLRDEYGKKGRLVAESMDWGTVTKQWESLIDSVLYPDGVPDKIEPHEIEYTLEEV